MKKIFALSLLVFAFSCKQKDTFDYSYKVAKAEINAALSDSAKTAEEAFFKNAHLRFLPNDTLCLLNEETGFFDFGTWKRGGMTKFLFIFLASERSIFLLKK